MTHEQHAAILNELRAIRDTTREDGSSNFRRIEAILATIEGEGAEPVGKVINGWVRPSDNGPGYELGNGAGWAEFNECGQPEHGDIPARLILNPQPAKEGAEPVAWMGDNVQPITATLRNTYEHAEHPILVHYDIPLYTHPPKPEQPVVTHLNMDPNASEETKAAVGEAIRAAYDYKPEQPRVVLTDEEIDQIADTTPPPSRANSHAEYCAEEAGFVRGLRYARDNGYLCNCKNQ